MVKERSESLTRQVVKEKLPKTSKELKEAATGTKKSQTTLVKMVKQDKRLGESKVTNTTKGGRK